MVREATDPWVKRELGHQWYAWPFHDADLPEDDMLSLPLPRVMRVLRYEALEAEQMAKEHGLETRRGA